MPKLIHNKKYTYFHFIGSNMGEHYFKVDNINNKVYKVTLSVGLKKGRPHCVGIYKIAYSSFLGTYYWYFGRKSPHVNVLITTKNQYSKAIEELTKTFLSE